jgi:hypothetical protein
MQKAITRYQPDGRASQASMAFLAAAVAASREG